MAVPDSPQRGVAATTPVSARKRGRPSARGAGEIIKFSRNGKEVLLPTPVTFPDACLVAGEATGVDATQVRLQTRDLAACQGQLCDLNERNWEVSRPYLLQVFVSGPVEGASPRAAVGDGVLPASSGSSQPGARAVTVYPGTQTEGCIDIRILYTNYLDDVIARSYRVRVSQPLRWVFDDFAEFMMRPLDTFEFRVDERQITAMDTARGLALANDAVIDVNDCEDWVHTDDARLEDPE
ncbi:uncharacterized protein SCHCODRAFT_02698899 [Schizophyllum commune H4-8]|uniref:uncharacterized protein n=1 Tax=Schizophyllum commune (strain H4-8 / FGSC 9210) TaxID=578458 RepID=UPI00215E83AA|nr:uncharacterized protein SCHCODRAFT_02698899 [Schizophyllum commune H4-8]KAI5894899.1 hypothetical protein SCHCODRAFT_02698899 [Schizophyllum commune H4-8]